MLKGNFTAADLAKAYFNMIPDSVIAQIAIQEVEDQSWGVTEQFCQVHEIERENNIPKVARVDRDRNDGIAIVYFCVRGCKFYFSVYIATTSEPSIQWVGTEPHSTVYFCAMSDNETRSILQTMTALKPTYGWDKGGLKNNAGSAKYSNSCIRFEPNPEADEFEDKLEKLLDFLEKDAEGVRRLVSEADGHIQVAMYFHNGNGMLGGPHINKDMMRRMCNLNVEIDFDLYAEGKEFKE